MGDMHEKRHETQCEDKSRKLQVIQGRLKYKFFCVLPGDFILRSLESSGRQNKDKTDMICFCFYKRHSDKKKIGRRLLLYSENYQ